MPWRSCSAIREVWGLVFAKFLSDAAWYFYLFWLPKYLYDARGFDLKQVGVLRLDPLCGGRASAVCSAAGFRAGCCSAASR